MKWCRLINSADYTLGCVNRVNNFYNTQIFATNSTFNPFDPIVEYTYEGLFEIEGKNGFERF